MSRVASLRYFPILVALFGVAVWLALCWHGPITNDVTWQLWIGRRLKAGATLYVDVMEINPPLWFWLAAAIEAGVAVWALAAPDAVMTAAAASPAKKVIFMVYPVPWRSSSF